jgi:hypothetical protein
MAELTARAIVPPVFVGQPFEVEEMNRYLPNIRMKLRAPVATAISERATVA